MIHVYPINRMQRPSDRRLVIDTEGHAELTYAEAMDLVKRLVVQAEALLDPITVEAAS